MSLRQERLKESKQSQSSGSHSKQPTISKSKQMAIVAELSKDKHLSRNDLRKIHELRSPQAQAVDESKRAKLAPSLKAWAKDPSAYDVSGIDYPHEWRSRNEIEEYNEIKQSLPGLRQKVHDAEDEQMRDIYKQNLQHYEQQLQLLEWQRKHPFIAAGTGHREGNKPGTGIKNYEWALKNPEKFPQLDLSDPEGSFIKGFYLKKHDVQGMRLHIERSIRQHTVDGRIVTALAWYDPNDREFHLPPKRAQDDLRRRNQVIMHEIGHHVQNQDIEMFGLFRSHYEFMKVSEDSYEVEKVSIPIWKAIWDAEDYFNADWWLQYDDNRKLLERHNANDVRKSQEMFAESFAAYRSGRMSSEFKEAKKWLQGEKKSLMEAKERRKNFKGDRHSQEYMLLNRTINSMENDIKIYEAVVHNFSLVYGKFREWDSQGWHPKR